MAAGAADQTVDAGGRRRFHSASSAPPSEACASPYIAQNGIEVAFGGRQDQGGQVRITKSTETGNGALLINQSNNFEVIF